MSLYISKTNNFHTEGVRDYKINLGLSEDLIKDVQNFKNIFSNKFCTAKYVESVAHISLNLFRVESIPEITIKNELDQLLSDWETFHVLISGFGQFPSSRTIFLNTSTEEIIKLQNHIRTVLRQRVKVAKKYTQAISKPHITIASDINKDLFDDCWHYFKDKKYAYDLVVNKILVFRINHSMNETRPRKAFEIFIKNK